MHKLHGIILAGAAVLMLGVLTSAAWAVSQPEFSAEVTAEGTSATGTLETNAAIVGKVLCATNTSQTASTSPKLGTFHIHFTKCFCKKTSALGGGTATAESLGDSAGIILALGTYHLVRLGTEHVGIWFLVGQFDIDCLYATEELLVIRGSFLGLILPILKTTKKYDIVVEQTGGKQAITEYENENGTKVSGGSLETEVANTGGYIKSAEGSESNNLTTSEAVEIIKTT
jgi:hypothetical protein